MLLKELYAVRDRSIKNSVIASLPDDLKAPVREALEKGFIAGDEVWRRKHLETLLGAKAAERLMDHINKTTIEVTPN